VANGTSFWDVSGWDVESDPGGVWGGWSSEIVDESVNWAGILGAGAQLAPSLTAAFAPVVTEPTRGPMYPGMGGETRLETIARSVSMRFPALAAALVSLRARGIRASAESLWALMRRYGPQLLTGLIGAAAVADLLLWRTTKKRRRMNVLNAKALRRSTRRLLGFERRAAQVTMALGGICRTRPRRSKRRGVCVVCHANPCRCP